MQMGEMHAASDVIDFDSAALIAEEFHAKVEHEVHVSIEERLFTQEEDSADQLVERPPVVLLWATLTTANFHPGPHPFH